jgi:hypothetical protein
MASGSQSLKIAKDVAKDLAAAKETSKYIYDSIRGTLAKEVGKTVTILTAVFLIISGGLIASLTWYYSSKVTEQQNSYEFWSQKADAAYSKCMKIKICANSLK